MKRFLILCALIGLGLTVNTVSAKRGLIDQAAPDFTLKSAQGNNIKLSEHRGEVVLINFWASWCGPCRQEMPLLDELHSKYEPLGFTMLGVNVEEDSSVAQLMLSELNVNFPILFDTENSVSESYAVDAMPTTIIIDRDGKVQYIHRGYKPGDEHKYQDAIRRIIRE